LQFILLIKQAEVKFGLGHFFEYSFTCWVCPILNKNIKICNKRIYIIYNIYIYIQSGSLKSNYLEYFAYFWKYKKMFQTKVFRRGRILVMLFFFKWRRQKDMKVIIFLNGIVWFFFDESIDGKKTHCLFKKLSILYTYFFKAQYVFFILTDSAHYSVHKNIKIRLSKS